MSFDPTTAVLVEEKNKKSFDPSTAKMAFDSTSANEAAPVDKMKLFANKISSGSSTPEDTSEYKKAYSERYDSTTLGSRISGYWNSIHPSKWGDSLADLGKSIQSNLETQYTASEEARKSGPEAYKQLQQKQTQAVVAGIPAGVERFANWGFGSGVDAFETAVANIGAATHNKEAVSTASDIAVRRLKDDAYIAKATAAPESFTPEQKSAYEMSANLTQAAIPIPGAGLASEAVGVGAKAIGEVSRDVVGLGMKASRAVPVVSKLAAIGTAAYHAPITTAVAYGAGKINKIFEQLTGEQIPLGGIVNVGKNADTISKGIFSGINEIGDKVIKTPLGDSVFNYISEQAPIIIKDSEQSQLFANNMVERANAALANAKEMGWSLTPYRKAIIDAKNQLLKAEIKNSVITRGVNVAKSLNELGASGMSDRLAKSVSAAIQASAITGAATAMSSKTGEVNNDAMADAAGIGSLFGLLGASAHSTDNHNKFTPRSRLSPLEIVNEAPSNLVSNQPKTNQGQLRLGYEGQLRLGYGENKGVVSPTTKPSGILVFDDGHPVPETTFTDNLMQASQSMADSAIERTSTRNYNLQAAGGSGKYKFKPPSDQHVDTLVSLSQPVQSSWIERTGYHPESETALIKVQPGRQGKGGVNTYILHDVNPEQYDAFIQGINKERNVEAGVVGSKGGYFNDIMKAHKNTWRVHENLWGMENQPPGATSIQNPELKVGGMPAQPLSESPAQVAPQAVPQVITPVIKRSKRKP